MDAQGIVILTLASAFGMGALAILVAGLLPSGRGMTSELWALYRSEFVIVGALLIPAALGIWAFLAAALAFLLRAQFELVRLFRAPDGRMTRPFGWGSISLIAAACAAAAGALRSGENGFLWIFYAYAIVEIGDAFALLTGKLFGRTRILPRLSPRKTAEGMIGGFVFGGSAGYFLALYLLELPPAAAAQLAFLVLLAGLAGDLLTSALKRAFGVKDFSPVLAKHGGVLDIYDSFLLAAPATFIFRYALAG